MKRAIRLLRSSRLLLTLLFAATATQAGAADFSIQAGAFADRRNADSLVTALQRAKHQAGYSCNGNGLYVVHTGRYDSRDSARREAQLLVAARLIEGYLVVPFAGVSAGESCGMRPRTSNAASLVNRSPVPEGGRKPLIRGINGTTAAAGRTRQVVSQQPQRVAEMSARAPENTTLHRLSPVQIAHGSGGETVQVMTQSPGIIEQREHGGRIVPAQAEPQTQLSTASQAGGGPLVAAWEQYRAGAVTAAAALFRQSIQQPELADEASFGLALCHRADKESSKAQALLEGLVKKHFRLRETVPALLGILLERQEMRKAADYLALLGGRERAVWQARIEQEVFIQEFRQLQAALEPTAALAFVNRHDAFLQQCRMADQFNRVAGYLAQREQRAEAAAIYRRLLACSDDEGMRLGMLYSLKPLVPADELLALAERQQHVAGVSATQRGKLVTFRLELLQERLTAEPEQAERHARAILALQPEHRGALAALGWWHFKGERYKEAYDCFSRLSRLPGRHSEHLEGMILSLVKLEQFDEALTVARLNSADRRIASLAEEVQLQLLWNRLAAQPPDSPEIEALVNAILQIRPDNENVRVVRAWWHYNRQEFEQAYREFSDLLARNPLGDGYAYGLVRTLAKLGRYDEAVAAAAANRQHDQRLTALETEIRREWAQRAYEQQRYREAELQFAKVVEADPDDEESKILLDSSRYRQTLLAKLVSPLAGLPGHSWGSVYHDLQGPAGTGGSFLLNQGIDWVRLPGDVVLRTYGEVWYRARSKEPRYHDLVGQAAGIELRKEMFRLGAEYAAEQYTRQDKHNSGAVLFLSWYRDWYRYLYDRSDDAGWFNPQSLSGSTYGRISQDLGGNTGTTATGSISQGIDWLTLPGATLLSSFLEYRFSFRSGDNYYYNEHGPVVGTELQKAPFRAGIEYYWQHETERQRHNQRATVYLKWYYDWNLKPNK